MVTNKQRVASYLDDNEVAALDELCKDNTYSRSEAVAHLVRNCLIENDEVLVGRRKSWLHEERIASLEGKLELWVDACFRLEHGNEKVRGQIAELQEEVSRLKEQIAKNEEEYFTDDEIAAATHQPEWKVRLWRHGQQKPRGKRIKKNLEPYIVEDGLWKKRADA